ncbi:MAG TPA: OmpH family outer membrane protein [Candidatus Sulfotelmatobacter sp.]|jgi:outer membrane protein|nr:OmpH family outer membrane protein [Candidatus Sulfotelmatobacter sp.]
MKIRFGISALAALLMLPAVWAQSNAAAPVKVGVISVQAAIQSTAEGKQAAAELQSQFAPRQTELDNLRKQIEDLQTRLRTTSNTLSDEEKARLAREGDQYTRTYQRKQQDSQDDYTEAEREIVDRIGRKMIDVLDKYSKDNGYSVILDTSAQNTPVIYAANTIDVTQDIIKLYDQSYPVKNAAAGTRPAAPRSTTPRPAPAQPAQQQPAPH